MATLIEKDKGNMTDDFTLDFRIVPQVIISKDRYVGGRIEIKYFEVEKKSENYNLETNEEND